MKKLVLMIAAIACISMTTNAQGMFEKGDNLFKAGIGVNGNGIPVELSFERGIINDFLGVENMVLGVGAGFGYYGYKQEVNIAGALGKYTYKTFAIAGRGLVHYPLVDKLDTYAGLLLGINAVTSGYEGPYADLAFTDPVSELSFGGIVGVRYEFSENLGAYAEVGYSTSYLNFGIAYKF